MDTKKTPLAVAVFVEIVYVVCALSVLLLPETGKFVYRTWFHGIDIATIWSTTNFTLTNFLVGFVSTFIASFIATWIFVKIYKAIAK